MRYWNFPTLPLMADNLILSKDEQLLDITADLVSLDENHPFLIHLFSCTAGKWVDVSQACSHLKKVTDKIQQAIGDSDEKLYATWLLYPEPNIEKREDDFCVIFFFTDIEHWNTNAIYNKKYFSEIPCD